MKKLNKLVGVSSYNEWEVGLLREDRKFAVEVAKLAVEGLNNPEERGGSLLALRAIAETRGGLGAVAEQAGISRESLYRALSPKGNPALKTLIAVLKTLGLRLSVTPEKQVRRRRKKTEGDCAAA
jgi:probable addiction module antidote protein